MAFARADVQDCAGDSIGDPLCGEDAKAGGFTAAAIHFQVQEPERRIFQTLPNLAREHRGVLPRRLRKERVREQIRVNSTELDEFRRT